MLTIEEITSENQFREVRPVWKNLLEKERIQSPFLSHDWFECCLAGYGRGKGIFTLVVRDGATVVGITPFWRYQETVRGIDVRKIGFITCPDTPYADFIISVRYRKEVLKTILHYLHTTRKEIWDVLTLKHWPAESPNYKDFHEILRQEHKKPITGVSSKTPYIPIQGDWEQFFQTRSVRFRKSRRNIVNRIDKLKTIELQCYREEKNGVLLKDILAVSQKSWKQKHGVAISSKEEAKRFFKNLTEVAGKQGWLLVWVLKKDSVPIAMEYDLVSGKKVYALRSDFDEAYSEFSPGAYLEYQIIKSLFKEDYLEYNTGPGMNTYKLQWTDHVNENVILHICNNNLRGLTVSALEGKLFPALRRIKGLTDKIGSW